jgi:hypothetical protein
MWVVNYLLKIGSTKGWSLTAARNVLSVDSSFLQQDGSHDGYIVLAEDMSTFHVRPANEGSFTVVEDMPKGELEKLESTLKAWEAKGGMCAYPCLSDLSKLLSEFPGLTAAAFRFR